MPLGTWDQKKDRESVLRLERLEGMGLLQDTQEESNVAEGGLALLSGEPDELQLLPGQQDDAFFYLAAVHHGHRLRADIEGLAQGLADVGHRPACEIGLQRMHAIQDPHLILSLGLACHLCPGGSLHLSVAHRSLSPSRGVRATGCARPSTIST